MYSSPNNITVATTELSDPYHGCPLVLYLVVCIYVLRAHYFHCCLLKASLDVKSLQFQNSALEVLALHQIKTAGPKCQFDKLTVS